MEVRNAVLPNRHRTARRIDSRLSVAQHICWSLMIGVVCLAAGCGTTAGLGAGAQPAVSDTSSNGPVAALRAAYELEGQQRPVVFLEAVELSDEEYGATLNGLSQALQVEVLPTEEAFRADADLPALTPVHAETGDLGVSLTFVEMSPVGNDTYEATVDYARNGLDGGTLILVLRWDGEAWSVVRYQHDAVS